MPSTPRSITSSKNSRIRSGLAPSNRVELVVTRKPRRSASLMAATPWTRTASARLLDGGDGLDVAAVAAHRLVVLLAEPVEVHAERQVLRGREQTGLELLLQKDGVVAEVDVLSARDQPLDEAADVGVHQRLAPGDRDDRRPALIHRRQALLDRQVLPQIGR